MAPAAGFEPATKWLTATYSTAEALFSSVRYYTSKLENNKPKITFLRYFFPILRDECLTHRSFQNKHRQESTKDGNLKGLIYEQKNIASRKGNRNH